MTELLQQKIKEEIVKISRDKQEAINSIDWIKISEEIGGGYLLNENEINNFQAETGFVLIGLLNLSLYKLNIENNVGVDSDIAEKMAKEAFEQIFNPIANKIESSVKSKIKNINPKWDQTVNFIISGGDYSAFIEKVKNISNQKVSYRETI